MRSKLMAVFFIRMCAQNVLFCRRIIFILPFVILLFFSDQTLRLLNAGNLTVSNGGNICMHHYQNSGHFQLVMVVVGKIIENVVPLSLSL